MPFVLDASVTAGWAFEDEDHSTATLALERIRSDQARVPSHGPRPSWVRRTSRKCPYR